jgi:hypothetical protein
MNKYETTWTILTLNILMIMSVNNRNHSVHELSHRIDRSKLVFITIENKSIRTYSSIWNCRPIHERIIVIIAVSYACPLTYDLFKYETNSSFLSWIQHELSSFVIVLFHMLPFDASINIAFIVVVVVAVAVAHVIVNSLDTDRRHI